MFRLPRGLTGEQTLPNVNAVVVECSRAACVSIGPASIVFNYFLAEYINPRTFNIWRFFDLGSRA